MIKQDIIIKEEECKQMDDLMSKQHALENLVLICENNPLVRNEELYQRFLSEYKITTSEINKLWSYLFETYHIEEDDSCKVYIDFNNCTLYSKEC